MRRRSLAIALSVGLLGAVLAGLVVWHFRPLVPFANYTASYSEVGGATRSADTYQMLFRPHVVFVHLPDASEWRWFAVDWTRREVFLPNAPRTFPYLSHNRDLPLGVRLPDANKMEGWTIQRRERELVISDGNLTVTVQEP